MFKAKFNKSCNFASETKNETEYKEIFNFREAYQYETSYVVNYNTYVFAQGEMYDLGRIDSIVLHRTVRTASSRS